MSSQTAPPPQPQESDKDKERKKTNKNIIAGSVFEVDTRFKIIKAIGQGAYGLVCSATCLETQEKVAIKKIAKAFDHLTDCKRTLREIKLLRHFDHENILSIDEILPPPKYSDFEDVYIVFELMDTDLHQIIGSPQPLTDDHCQYFVYQILRGLKYIHSAEVLHRDLKPSNILLNGNCDLKICDFGLARVASPDVNHRGFMTEYVATRWYRAPEIMLSWKEYTKAIDIWSVGCIFAEILSRKPLFAGRDYLHQLELITDVLGTPTEDDIKNIGSQKARNFIKAMPFKEGIKLSKILPKDTNPLAIDLLERMLMFDPSKRISCEDALAHPYLASLHDPTDEPIAPEIFDFEWEEVKLTQDLIKALIFEEIKLFHPEVGQDPTYNPDISLLPLKQHLETKKQQKLPQ